MNLRMAFQFVTNDGTVVEESDPSHPKMIVHLIGLDQDGNYVEKAIPHHKCTEEEYAEFYPIESDQENLLKDSKSLGDFHCIDWNDEDPHLVFGTPLDRVWQSIAVVLVPCDYVGLGQ